MRSSDKIKKYSVLILLGLVLAIITEFFFSFPYDASMVTKETRGETVSCYPENLRYENCQFENGCVWTTGADPQILWENLDTHVGYLAIQLEDLNGSSFPCEVYWAETGSEFSQDKMIRTFVREDRGAVFVYLDQKVTALRLDIGEREGIQYKLKSMELNPSVSKMLMENRSNMSMKRILLYCLLFVFILLLVFDRKQTFSGLFRYRWLWGFLLILLCTILKLNGSSLGEISQMLGYQDTSRLWGTSRPVRSDEFVVFSQMALAQVRSGFQWFSDIWGYSPSDMILVYGQPVKSILAVYRPFSMFYLILGAERGMAFYWSSRLIICFLVSFEFGRILTKDHRKLAAAYAFMIALSPIVAWWFSINELVEILIFGQGAVVLFNQYIQTKKTAVKTLIMAGLVICAGGYVMVLYPAWMIPMFYVFLASLVALVLTERKKIQIYKKDLAIWGCGIGVFVLSMIYLFLVSGDTIHAVMHTVYPGERIYTGGSLVNIIAYFRGWTSWLWTLVDRYNPCEAVCFISFFPLGIILSGLVLFKEKKKDCWLIVLNLAGLFLMFYNLIALPAFIGKVTLLGNTTYKRMVGAIGLMNLIILFRSISVMEEHRKTTKLMLVLTPLVAGVSCMVCGDSLTAALKVVVFAFCGVFIWIIGNSYSEKGKTVFTAACIAVSLLGGGFVNPIESGLDCIYHAPIVQMMEILNREDPGSWIVLNNLALSNLPTVAGAKSVNALATYPDTEFWKVLGLENEDEIWNRYAHIEVAVDEQVSVDLNRVDWLTVHMPVTKMRDLGVKYVLSPAGNELKDGAVLLFSENGYSIWKI